MTRPPPPRRPGSAPARRPGPARAALPWLLGLGLGAAAFTVWAVNDTRQQGHYASATGASATGASATGASATGASASGVSAPGVSAPGTTAAGTSAPAPSPATPPPLATPQATAPLLRPEIVARLPHDPAAFTQGLLVHSGRLFEGTGGFGTSELRELDLESGEVLRRVPFPDEVFGEGLAELNGRLYQLSWRNGIGFVWDTATLEPLGEFALAGEGWGLTTDGELLILSDGSDTLFFYDPAGLSPGRAPVPVRTVRVRDAGTAVPRLNELEYIGGNVYANVWLTDRIAVIDPTSGRVRAWLDASEMVAEMDAQGVTANPDAVLNGIAHDPDTGRTFLTGKLWPTLYEVRLPEVP